jgi:hypothetical protein
LFNQLLLLFLNYARYKRGAAYDFPGEGWVKGGEGSAQPFTRASYLATDIYAILVKGEGCF